MSTIAASRASAYTGLTPSQRGGKSILSTQKSVSDTAPGSSLGDLVSTSPRVNSDFVLKRVDSIHTAEPLQEEEEEEEDDTVPEMKPFTMRRANTDGPLISSSSGPKIVGRTQSGFFFSNPNTKRVEWRSQSSSAGADGDIAGEKDEDERELDDNTLLTFLNSSNVSEKIEAHRGWIRSTIGDPEGTKATLDTESAGKSQRVGDNDDEEEEDDMPQIGLVRRKTTPAVWTRI